MMNQVISSYLNDFSKSHGFMKMGESDKFERFINFCTLYSHCAEKFDIDEMTTKSGEVGIDGGAILVGGSVMHSSEETREKLENRTKPVEVKYIFNQAKRSTSFRREKILSFGQAVNDLLSPNPTIQQDDWLEEIKKIHEVVIEKATKVKKGLPSIYMYYVTTGDWKKSKDENLQSAVESIENNISHLNTFEPVYYECIGSDQIRSKWLQTQSPVKAEFKIKKNVVIPDMEDVTQAFLAVVNAKDYVKSVVTNEEGNVKSNIFDRNVRHYLGSNEVNSKIESTLKDNSKKQRFAIMNNGVTIIASNATRVSEKLIIEDYQIVNGCQTSYVLYQGKKELDESVNLSVKVIETSNQEVIDSVIKATNSQTDISDSQLLAVKEHTRNIQEFFTVFGEKEIKKDRKRVYFERRSREYYNEDIPDIKVFDIHLLGKVFAAMFLELPHKSTAYAGSLFNEGKNIFSEKYHEMAYYTSAFVYYKIILAISSSLIDSDYTKAKWQILMIARSLEGGVDIPDWSNDKAIKSYCEKIMSSFRGSTSDLESLMSKSTSILKSIGGSDRSKLKTAQFTENLRAEIKRVRG